MTDAASLMERVVMAFPVAPAPEAEEIIADLSDDLERAEIREAFRGRAWNALPFEQLRYHADSLYLFSPAAWVYYAPAYMCALLRDYFEADMISRTFVTTLHETAGDLLPRMSVEQQTVLHDFLLWMLITEPDHPRRDQIESVVRNLGISE